MHAAFLVILINFKCLKKNLVTVRKKVTMNFNLFIIFYTPQGAYLSLIFLLSLS